MTTTARIYNPIKPLDEAGGRPVGSVISALRLEPTQIAARSRLLHATLTQPSNKSESVRRHGFTRTMLYALAASSSPVTQPNDNQLEYFLAVSKVFPAIKRILNLLHRISHFTCLTI